MCEKSGVELVQIKDGDAIYRASYYVLDGAIHANIGGRSLMTALGSVPAASTVKALLLSSLLSGQRIRSWSDFSEDLVA